VTQSSIALRHLSLKQLIGALAALDDGVGIIHLAIHCYITIFVPESLQMRIGTTRNYP
jgi:hypothetical protein